MVVDHVSVFKHVLRRMQHTLLRVPISESSSRGSVPLGIGVARSSKASNLTLCGRVAPLCILSWLHLNFLLPSLPFPPPPPSINLNLNRTYHICYCLIVDLLSGNGPATLKARLYHRGVGIICRNKINNQPHLSSTPSTNNSSF